MEERLVTRLVQMNVKIWTLFLVAAVCLASGLGPVHGNPNNKYEWTPVPPNERLVGIAYTNWHREGEWSDSWGTPKLGYYDSLDREVIRTHARWLAEAGVDFVWIDWSNNVNHVPGVSDPNSGQGIIEQSTDILFEEYAALPECERPRISIFAGVTLHPDAATDGRLQRKADQIHIHYVAHPEYGKLIQYYEGKPLLVVYVHTPSPWLHGTADWDDDRFTVRWMTGYVSEQPTLRTEERISKYGYWSWEDRGDQTFPIHNGHPESMVVVASWRPQYALDGFDYIPAMGRRNGETFRERWAHARKIGPKFAMVVSWNEWVMGEQPSSEISKDLEPSKEHGREYLDLLAREIAIFKGQSGRVGVVEEEPSTLINGLKYHDQEKRL